ncbi:hypothetical protein CWI41_020740 [Ordospora colligata]|nr:hypothetical protein CWI41_020740 [Ordospora colligata]
MRSMLFVKIAMIHGIAMTSPILEIFRGSEPEETIRHDIMKTHRDIQNYLERQGSDGSRNDIMEAIKKINDEIEKLESQINQKIIANKNEKSESQKNIKDFIAELVQAINKLEQYLKDFNGSDTAEQNALNQELKKSKDRFVAVRNLQEDEEDDQGYESENEITEADHDDKTVETPNARSSAEEDHDANDVVDSRNTVTGPNNVMIKQKLSDLINAVMRKSKPSLDDKGQNSIQTLESTNPAEDEEDDQGYDEQEYKITKAKHNKAVETPNARSSAEDDQGHESENEITEAKHNKTVETPNARSSAEDDQDEEDDQKASHRTSDNITRKPNYVMRFKNGSPNNHESRKRRKKKKKGE